MHRDSLCSDVRIRKDVAEQTLVELVRTQAQLLVTAEQMLKEKKNKPKKGMDAGSMRTEIRRLEEAKVSDYEKYKERKLTREMFLERKKCLTCGGRSYLWQQRNWKHKSLWKMTASGSMARHLG